jgi:superkiller protein 3
MLRNKEQQYFDTEQLEDLIEHYISSWQYGKANRAISYAKHLYPFDRSFDLYLAKSYAYSGKPEEALNLISEIELVEAGNSDLILLKGEVLYMLKRYEEALICFEYSLDNGHDEIEVRLNIANMFMDQSKYEDAKQVLIKVLPKLLTDEYVFDLCDSCFIETNAIKEGIQLYNNLIDDHPYSFFVWKHLAELYRELELYEKSIWALGFCEAIDETNSHVSFTMAECFFELSKYDEALTIFNQLIESEPENPMFYYFAGNCKDELEQHDAARKLYRQAIKLNPKYAAAWYGMAATYFNEQQYSRAKGYIEKALKIKPLDPHYQMHLVTILMELEEYDNAHLAYTNLIENSPEIKEVWLDFALLLHEQTSTEQALDLLDRSVKYHQEDAAIYYRLASYSFTLGKGQDGMEYLVKALTLNPEDNFLLYLHAPFLYHLDAVTEVVDSYTKR